MEIRKSCSLAKLYKSAEHPINEEYEELMLIRAAVAGDKEGAQALFKEIKLFKGKKTVIDTPYRRYEGIEGVNRFVEEFLSIFHASKGIVIPVVQTRANGRSVTELQIDFEINGMIDQVPMFIVADLRCKGFLDEVRIYFHCSYIEGLQAYRKPMFRPAYLEMGDPGLLTGAVREYYEALHTLPHVDVERIMGCTDENCKFGGYMQDTPEEESQKTRDVFRKAYEHMAEYIPRCVGMRYETIIDDGRTCIIEWVHIVSREGQEELGRIALSGIAAYERGDNGLLCAIRISDYANLERTIDWSKVEGITETEAKKINFVEKFPQSSFESR